jgi:hypothetical protein
LTDLMDDPKRRVSLGVLGSQRIKTQLAWDYSVPNLLHAYRLVLPAATQSKRGPSEDARLAAKSQSSAFAQTPGYRSAD